MKEIVDRAVIPAEEVRTLIEAFLVNEFKTDRLKWVMTDGNGEYQEVGSLEVDLSQMPEDLKGEMAGGS